MRGTRYRIKHHTDEGYCSNCGGPMLVGDEGIQGERGAYCCEPCYDEGEGHNDGLMPVDGSDYYD